MTMNMTNLTNVDSLQGLAVFTNNQTGGVLFMGGIIALFIVMVMVLLKNNEPLPNVLSISGWLMFVISCFFWFAGLLSTLFPLLFLIIAGISTLILYNTH